MMPMTRREMIAAIEALAKPTLVQGYYVNTDEDEPFDANDFCLEHAQMVTRWVALAMLPHDSGAWPSTTSMGTDGQRFCAFGGCDKHLDFGGLTDHGIDDALGLTESDALACHVYPSELDLAAAAMRGDDPRWETWEKHAIKILGRKARR